MWSKCPWVFITHSMEAMSFFIAENIDMSLVKLNPVPASITMLPRTYMFESASDSPMAVMSPIFFIIRKHRFEPQY